MVFSLWRDEKADLVQRNCEEFYQGHEEAIKANFDRFNFIESLEDALRRAMVVEENNEENIDEEAAVNEEFRALAFLEISSQVNVLSLNNVHVQEIDGLVNTYRLVQNKICHALSNAHNA